MFSDGSDSDVDFDGDFGDDNSFSPTVATDVVEPMQLLVEEKAQKLEEDVTAVLNTAFDQVRSLLNVHNATMRDGMNSFRGQATVQVDNSAGDQVEFPDIDRMTTGGIVDNPASHEALMATITTLVAQMVGIQAEKIISDDQ